MFDWNSQAQFFIDSVQKALSAPFQTWLAQRPLAFWLASHPLWLLAAVLLAIFLFAGLLRAVAGLTERFWLALLKLPVWLVQGIWWSGLLLLRPFFPAVQPPPASRLSEVMQRLEALRQEENELMQELQSLLSAQAKSPNPKT